MAIEYSEDIRIIEYDGKNIKTYYANLWNDKKLLKLLFEKLSIIKESNIEYDYIREDIDFSNGWCHFFMGMRHHLFIKKQFKNIWREKYDNKELIYMEQTWIKYIFELL